MAVPKGFFNKLSKLFRSGPRAKRTGKSARGADTAIAAARNNGVSVVQKSQSPSFANATGNAYNLTERLMRYQDFCLGKDTLVYTLDGVFTLKDLAERYPSGQRFFVYSYDYEKKSPTIGTAFFPRIANGGKKSERLRVTLDDGGYVDCTPDHRFILRDGSTREARDLRANDSLMPLYIRSENESGYNVVYTLDHVDDDTDKCWRREHIFVAECFYGDINHQTHVVHHKDFNKKNNHPSNLEVMLKEDHSSLHASLNNVNKFGKSNNAHSKWMRENAIKREDLTFRSIVDAFLICKNVSEVVNMLNAKHNVINLRLREKGFKNLTDLASRIDEAQELATHETIEQESRSPEIEDILLAYEHCESLDELASKLCCTRASINRRLQAHGFLGGWTELKTGKPYVGSKRGPAYSGPSYQEICSAYKPGMTQQQLADAVNTTKNKLGTCLKRHGFFSFTKWAEQFKNHKVASVTSIDDDVVYTVTVEKYHNLAVGSLSSKNPAQRAQSLVFVTNCEMEYTPELASALDIYADETVASDEKDQIFHVFAPNEAIKIALEDLFYNVLNIEFNLRGWVRNLCKYGDFFALNEIDPEQGIIRVVPMPVNEIEREEGFDQTDPLLYRFRWSSYGNKELDCWQVTHIRLLGNDQFLPYGMSVIEAARRIWRQLILIEDAMLTYRIVRAPERRVFYVDVGNTPPEDVPLVVEETKRNIRTAPVVDRTTGRADLRYNPVSIEEDYWIAVRGQDTGTKIDTLQGGQNAAAVEDVQYIQKKLFAALKIPKAYLGYDEALSSKATLAQEDIRFSRTISVIQKTVLAELQRLAIIHLYCLGFPEEELQDFSIRLSNPSTVAQQQKLELLRAKAEIAGAFPEGTVDRLWIRKEVLNFTDEHIAKIDELRLQERKIDAAIEAAGEPPESDAGGGSGGGGDLFGGSSSGGSDDLDASSEEPVADSPEASSAEPDADLSASAEPDALEEPDVALLTSGDEPDTQSKAKRRAARKRHHGASALAAPDIASMISRSVKDDPFDSHWLKTAGKNPLAEEFVKRPGLSSDMIKLLQRIPRRTRSVI